MTADERALLDAQAGFNRAVTANEPATTRERT